MLCSDCGQEIKPVVCLDIDGTLGDFHGHLIEFAKQYFQYDPVIGTHGRYDGGERMRHWFTRTFACTLGEYHNMKLAFRQGGLKRSMPTLDHPWILTQDLKTALGVEIWLTTTRPYLRFDSVDPDTRFWLKHNNIYYDYLLYDENKYRKLAELIDRRRVVTILDDLSEELENAEVIYGDEVCVLRRSSYNRYYWKRWRGFDRREDIFGFIRERVNRWNEGAAEQASVSAPGGGSDLPEAEPSS